MRTTPKCIDAEVLARIKRQRSEAFLAGLIELFLEEGPARLLEAWDGGKSRDWRRAGMATHILRCLADNIGALAVRDLAWKAELACVGNPERDPVLSLLLFDLEIAFAETRSCLASARSAPSGPA
ncbi:MAG: hypothetical protein JF616_05715 [Fibrobacteres bacterium]|jgi:hypothetical protein|nr:hypothetical protein [Fibrobacterota bacterium]